MSLADVIAGDVSGVFLSVNDFAVVGSVTTADLGTRPVNLVFCDAGMLVTLFPDVQYQGDKPFAICSQVDVPTVKKNETFVIAGTTYYAVQALNGFEGMRMVELSTEQQHG